MTVLYTLFWKKFKEKAFGNNEYASMFSKSVTLDRASYIVSINNNDMGFVVRKKHG